MRHNAIVLYVSPLPAYWETNTAVVPVQMIPNFFMWNVTGVLFRTLGLNEICLLCETGVETENVLCEIVKM